MSRIGVCSSLNFWYYLLVKSSDLVFLFVGRFFIRVLISMLVISLSVSYFFLVLLWEVIIILSYSFVQVYAQEWDCGVI